MLIQLSGNKKDNITIVYTPWSNLKKDGSMAVGQVGFKDQRKVKRVHVEKRENPIVNRLNKTKVEKYPDLAMEREARQKELRKKDRDAQQARVCSSSLQQLLGTALSTSRLSSTSTAMLTVRSSEKRKLESRKNGRRRPISVIMPTMISSVRKTWLPPATRIDLRISSTIFSSQ